MGKNPRISFAERRSTPFVKILGAPHLDFEMWD